LDALSCERCFEIHRAGCAGTHVDENGRPICVFCLDGVPCPVQQRLARGKGAIVMEPETKNLTETQAPTAPRICERPGCGRTLSAENKIGRCRRHVRWNAASSDSASPGARHASAGSNGTNGHPPEPASANGSAPVNEARSVEISAPLPRVIREDRVDRLLLSLPLADKTRIATAWLAGEL
jgi:hypothetical protein